jgi:hypothetical protein
MGSSVAGYNSIYEKFLLFKLKWQNDRRTSASAPSAAASSSSSAAATTTSAAPLRPLYVATVDVKQCFDTIERDRLLHILDKVILEVRHFWPALLDLTIGLNLCCAQKHYCLERYTVSYPPFEGGLKPGDDLNDLHHVSSGAMLRVRARRHVSAAATIKPFVPSIAAQKALHLRHVIVGETVRVFCVLTFSATSN